MAEPLLSTSWYRVAGLRPRLAAQLGLMRQPVRGQVWHVLTDAGSGRQLRLNPAAYEFAGRCDGSRTVGELWDILVSRLGNAAPTQDDLLRLLAQLYRAGMLQFDAAPNLAMLFEQRSQQQRSKRRAWVNPFIIRMRLFDPTRLLDRIAPALRGLWSPAGLLMWVACVATGLAACVLNYPALRAHGVALMAEPRALWLLWLCYPFIKAVHELGHALAVRRWGGAVHEVGMTLIFFTPAPYVDASAANAFAKAHQRMLVSAAGIMVELAIGALAAGVWLVVEPGLVRDAALVTLTICTVSTLLFNGNPLMRLDGYYILCDALGLPNLALRSAALWSTWWRRLALGQDAVAPVELARGELKWLVLYAPLSWLYRLVLLFALVTWAGARSWLFGWVVALAVAGWMLVPLLARALRLLDMAGAAQRSGRALGLLAGSAALVLLLLFVLPVPSSTMARGVVWPHDNAQLRSETGGFIAELPLADGAAVTGGDVLVRLSDPSLTAERDRRESQLQGLQAQQYQALLSDPARAAKLAEDIARAEAELARAQEQLTQLDVRGQAAGQLVLPHFDDLPGSFTARGAMVGYILAPGAANVRAVLPEQDVTLVRERARGVEVRLAEAPGTALVGSLRRQPPAATRALPSAALGDRFGGDVVTDPADKQGLRTVDPVFLLDVSVPAAAAQRIGARVWLRFDLGYEPIGWQWARRLRQLLLKHFNPLGQA